jgi:hypothetical protein
MKCNTYKFCGGSRDGDERAMIRVALNSEVYYPLRTFNPMRTFSDDVSKLVENRIEIYRCEDEYTLVYTGIKNL